MKLLNSCWITILFALLVFTKLCSGQQNTIKAMAGFIISPYSFAILSIGYERQLTRHSAVDLNCFAFADADIIESESKAMLGVSLGYRFYSVSEKGWLDNFWASPYFLYSHVDSHAHTSEYRGNFLGIGASVGRRIVIANNNKWIVDIGFGMAYGKFSYYYFKRIYDFEPEESVDIYKLPEPYFRWIPRPIIQVGYRL